MVNTNGALVNPTNFFRANSNALNASVGGLTSALNPGRIFIGSASSNAASQTLSGDANLATNGALTLSNSATARNNLGLGTIATVNSPVPIANGGTGATTARASGQNVGVYQMSPNNGNNAFTDRSSAANGFAGQLGVSYFGTGVPYLWNFNPTSNTWDGQFAFPDVVHFGDPTHMAIADGSGSTAGYSFIVNGNTNQSTVGAWDNVMFLQNEHTNHYSALVLNFGSRNNLTGFGAVFGLGNGGTGTGIFSNAAYFEIVNGIPLKWVMDARGFTKPVLELAADTTLNYYKNNNSVAIHFNPDGTADFGQTVNFGGLVNLNGSVTLTGHFAGPNFTIDDSGNVLAGNDGNLSDAKFRLFISQKTGAGTIFYTHSTGEGLGRVDGTTAGVGIYSLDDASNSPAIKVLNHFGGGDSITLKYSTSVTSNLVIGAGSNDGSAILQADSTAKGFLPPRMTKSQRNSIPSPVAGLVVYQTDSTPGLRAYNGTHWVRFTESNDD
jgi:hypothetical protein